MNYNPYYQGQFYNPYTQAVPDNLSQLRQNGINNTQMQPQMQQPDPPDARIWVQGEAGAKAYMVAAGCTVALWDSEQQKIYLKSVNLNGLPTMQTLTYSFDSAQPAISTPQAIPDMSNYVTKEELENRIKSILCKNEE